MARQQEVLQPAPHSCVLLLLLLSCECEAYLVINLERRLEAVEALQQPKEEEEEDEDEADLSSVVWT